MPRVKNSTANVSSTSSFSGKERYALGTAIVGAFPSGLTQPCSKELAKRAAEAILTAAKELQIPESDLLDTNNLKTTAVANQLAEFMSLKAQNQNTKIVERALIFVRDSKLLETMIKEQPKPKEPVRLQA